MKVAELIQILQTFDQELLVVVDGYEGGLAEPGELGIVRINLNVNTNWYYGRHKEVYKNESFEALALHIPEENNPLWKVD